MKRERVPRTEVEKGEEWEGWPCTDIEERENLAPTLKRRERISRTDVEERRESRANTEEGESCINIEERNDLAPILKKGTLC